VNTNELIHRRNFDPSQLAGLPACVAAAGAVQGG
jgi:hypothetical protein